MKSAMLSVALTILVLFGTVTPSRAGEFSILTVEVPFAFAVADVILPAGHYTVRLDRMNSGRSLLILRSEERGIVTRAMPLPDSRGRLTAGAWLTFHKYDNAYFLAKVESHGEGCELTRTAAEKELAANPADGGASVALAAE